MSTTQSSDVDRTVAACRPAESTPVELSAESLDSTAQPYLRRLKAQLVAEGYQPAILTANACFGEDCSLATQSEADRLRGYVRAAAFLGVGRFVLSVDDVANPEKVRPALSALEERAAREGVRLTIDGDFELAAN
jgi:hypothetical protein